MWCFVPDSDGIANAHNRPSVCKDRDEYETSGIQLMEYRTFVVVGRAGNLCNQGIIKFPWKLHLQQRSGIRIDTRAIDIGRGRLDESSAEAEPLRVISVAEVVERHTTCGAGVRKQAFTEINADMADHA